MSLYFGKRWIIDGVTAGPINRHYPNNGHYRIIFEREYAFLEQIEKINWEKPTIRNISGNANEPGLPEGYGFEVVKIEYDSSSRHYTVEVRTASQYLGDVTEYRDRITELETASAEKDSTITEQASTIQTQEDTIQKQTVAIQVLQDAGSAADLEADLDAAYEEGVNSVE